MAQVVYGNCKGWMKVRGHKIAVHIGSIMEGRGGLRAYVLVIDEHVDIQGLPDRGILFGLRVGELGDVYKGRCGRPIAVSLRRLSC
jgi:hypothetical protein